MPSYYEYLISSLPALSFGARPPMSLEGLVAVCENMVSDNDMRALKAIKDGSLYSGAAFHNGALKKWLAFDIMLKNEIVAIRAARKKIDPSKFFRPDGHPSSYRASHIAINAYRAASPLETEKMLDLERWQELDDMNFGHYFDADALMIYALKLAILQKWETINLADRSVLLEKVLGAATL